MLVTGRRQSGITPPAVGVNHRPALHSALDEGKQAVCRDISDLLKADAAKPPAVLLDCYGDDGLALGFSASRTLFRATNIGFINLDRTRQQVSARPAGEPWVMAGGWLRCRACRKQTSLTAAAAPRQSHPARAAIQNTVAADANEAFQKLPVHGRTSTRSDRGMEPVHDTFVSSALLNVERQLLSRSSTRSTASRRPSSCSRLSRQRRISHQLRRPPLRSTRRGVPSFRSQRCIGNGSCPTTRSSMGAKTAC